MFGQPYKPPISEPTTVGVTDCSDLRDYGLRAFNKLAASQSTTEPCSASPLERTVATLNEARELSARVRIIVDTLIGTRPEDSMVKRSDVGSHGLITGLAENAEDASDYIRQGQHELSRLSQVLGLGL